MWSHLLCLSALLLCSNYLAWVTSLYCDNCRYNLTMTDYFTTYVEACPLPTKTVDCVAKSLYQTFCCHGAPAHIVLPWSSCSYSNRSRKRICKPSKLHIWFHQFSSYKGNIYIKITTSNIADHWKAEFQIQH